MRVSLSNSRKSRTEEKPQRRISKSQGDSARWALTAARWRISAGRAALIYPHLARFTKLEFPRTARFRLRSRQIPTIASLAAQDPRTGNSSFVNWPTKQFAGRSKGYAQAKSSEWARFQTKSPSIHRVPGPGPKPKTICKPTHETQRYESAPTRRIGSTVPAAQSLEMRPPVGSGHVDDVLSPGFFLPPPSI
jgi:hypothetical protein